MIKFSKILLLTFIVLSLYANLFGSQAKDIWNDARNFLDIGAGGISGDGTNTAAITNGFLEILDFLYGIGILVVFAATIVLGIKYMLVQPNEKSRIKQSTTPWIIGVVIIFGAVTIWRLMISIIDGSMGIGG